VQHPVLFAVDVRDEWLSLFGFTMFSQVEKKTKKIFVWASELELE